MKWSYAVTWESMTQAPMTYRGTLIAGSARTAAARAVSGALKQGRATKGYCSIMVLLERPQSETDANPKDSELGTITE